LLWLITLCALATGLSSGQGQRAIRSSAFQGRAIVHKDGTPVPPDEAQVWILFGSDVLYEGMPDRQHYIDSAALQFENQRGRLLAQGKKAMQSLLGPAKENPTSNTENQVSANAYKGYMIRVDDEALAATMAWAQAHKNKSSQVKIITPEPDGTWFVGDLIPGIYHIVVRARFEDYQAEWESGITVKFGETFTIAEIPPRLFYRSVDSR
jgi:hypothetical protein